MSGEKYLKDVKEAKMNSIECLEKIAPFLERLIEPRYDSDETNDYINNSSDCKNALIAFQEWIAENNAA